MNWGYKILMVYAVFIVGIVTLVYKSSMQNQDLVAQDYYDQELKYQDKIDQSKRAALLTEPITYLVRHDEVEIHFPGEMKGRSIKATVLLYCARDERKDVEKRLVTTDAVILFPITAGNSGLYTLKINWAVGEATYYYEKKIIIP